MALSVRIRDCKSVEVSSVMVARVQNRKRKQSCKAGEIGRDSSVRNDPENIDDHGICVRNCKCGMIMGDGALSAFLKHERMDLEMGVGSRGSSGGVLRRWKGRYDGKLGICVEARSGWWWGEG